jgi:uncharacterized protein (TIGR03382 family)
MLKLCGVLMFVVLASPAGAALITSTLGAQDFADGVTTTSGAFLTAGSGEPVPFDGVLIGSDSASNFNATWAFSYSPIIFPILTATLTFGIFDHDSAASGSQVSSFVLNGSQNLTSNLDSLFEASQGAQSQVRVYTLVLPGSTFAALASGTASFNLILQGPGLGVLGETGFNGAGLDFATLEITAQDEVPEPGAMTLCLLGLSSLAVLGLRRRRQERHSSSR